MHPSDTMGHRLWRQVATSLPVSSSMGCSGSTNVKLHTTPTNTFSPPHTIGKSSFILCLFTSLLTRGRGFLVSSGGKGKLKSCYESLFSQLALTWKMLLRYSGLLLKSSHFCSLGKKKLILASFDSRFCDLLFLSGHRNEAEFTMLSAQSCHWGHSCETAGKPHLASIWSLVSWFLTYTALIFHRMPTMLRTNEEFCLLT